MAFPLVLLSVLVLCDSGFSQGYFSIVGPRTVQAGMDYNAYLTFNDYRNSMPIEVLLKGSKTSKHVKREIILHNQGTQQLTFKVSD